MRLKMQLYTTHTEGRLFRKIKFFRDQYVWKFFGIGYIIRLLFFTVFSFRIPSLYF